MELTPEERFELAEELWDSIAPEQLPPMTTAELDELDQEVAAHKADPSGAQSWEVVRTWLRSRRK
jgi:putative addiction module component (TIGR02574 family)